MKIWIVTTGEYSDYCVVAICSTKEIAERTKQLTGSNNDVFGMEVDEAINVVPDGFFGWSVDMDRNGNAVNVENYVVTERSQLRALPYGINPRHHHLNVHNCYNFIVVAKDVQSAVKIANEKRVQIIADNGWFEGDQAWSRWMQHLKKKI